MVNFLLLAAISAVVLLACGDGKAAGKVIEVRAENTRFSPEVIEVPAGQTVTLRLKNLDPNEHDLEVRGISPTLASGGGHEGHGSGVSLRPLAVHAAARKSATVTFRVDEKGTYEVICTIPGHEQSGMVARLVVI